MTMTTPSELLTESLAAFTKAAHQALSEAETLGHTQASRANAEARDARIERDKAMAALHASQLEGQAWKQEVVSAKAALEQAELTLSHQADIIAQLRREANQWRDQSRNWQEHFLRVEQERCAMSTRIDELVFESLQRTDITSAPHTPYHRRDDLESSSSSRPPAYKSAPPVSPDVDQCASTSANHSTAKPSKRPQVCHPLSGNLPPHRPQSTMQPAETSRKRKSHSPPPVRPAEMRVIRRVQAVVHVKREESEDPSLPELESRRRSSDHTRPVTMTRSNVRRQGTRVKPVPENMSETGSTPEDNDSIRTNSEDPAHFSDSGGTLDDQDELMLVAEVRQNNYLDARPAKARKSLQTHRSTPPTGKLKQTRHVKPNRRKI